MKKNIHISTASSIHGVDIKQSLGFISAHVVTGTNIFSDIFASFSDFFGGRSNSYKKQLTSIKNEAIEELKQECIKLGGNGIVALSIDLDEISGKNMSMMMITASGTAVKGSEQQDSDDVTININTTSNSELDHEELQSWIYKCSVLNQVKSKTLEINTASLEKIIEHKIFNIGEYILESYEINRNYMGDDHWLKFAEYFSALPRESSIDLLYQAATQYTSIRKEIIDVMNLLKMFDDEKVRNLLESTDIESRKLALQFLELPQETYTKEDIKRYKSILQIIDDAFPFVSDVYEVKKMIGSKSVWKCVCDHEVDVSRVTCDKCYADKRGFKSNDLDIDKVKQRLKNRIAGLSYAFSE